MKSFFLVIAFLLIPTFAVFAQEVHEELKEIVTANVTNIQNEEEREIEGTGVVTHVQQVEALITSGSKEGDIAVFENELVPLKSGDTVYLHYIQTINGDESFMFKDFKRDTGLIVLLSVFVLLLVLFAKMQGVRALLSLGLSVIAILFLLVPAILNGYNPILASIVIAGGVLALVLFLTHGINARSTIAFFGTFGAVLVTSFIAWISVTLLKLTGFGSDASVYLNFSTNGTLDFAGLLLASIIIGILGVLDDVSITQASVVQELKHANNTLNKFELYRRAINVGKDHIGSLVNTLALAYMGVSLPLVLLLATADAPLGLTLNQEVVAAELVRIIVGSIGLVLAIPITTWIAASWYGNRTVDEKTVSSHGHYH